MKRKWEIVALIIALGFLAAVLLERRTAHRDAVAPKYHAALYYAHVKAVDDQTSEPIAIEIIWKNYEQISPYSKGSGPSIIETHADGSVTVALVGKKLDNGLRIGIAADGYHRESLQLDPEQSGFLATDSSSMITEVRLRRKIRNDDEPATE